VDQIASRLDDRFRLLTGGSRTALPRQRTLQAAIDWSYRLLSEEERLVLQRLSAFAGGWTIEAAEAVCAGEGLQSSEILDLLLRLLDKSLVLAETEGSGPRYHMLETIRQYAQEKLDESGEAEQARRRHLDYFVARVERAEPQFKGPDAPLWIDGLDEERDNLRVAFEFGIHSEGAESAVRLVNAAFWLWWARGPWSEGQRWAEAALGKAREDQPAAKAKLLMVLGCFLFTQSDYARARDVYEKSLAIWRTLEDKFWNAFTLVMLSFVVRVENPSAATDLVLEGLRLGREGNDPWVVATCLCFSGEAALNRGDLAAAREMLAESAALFRTVGDRWVKNEMLRAMGELAEVEGDYPRAVYLYKESLAASHEIGDTTSPGEVNGNLARVMLLTGNFDEARRLCEQILREALQQGKKINVLGALAGFGVIAQARGDAGRAVRLLQASESLFDGLRASLYVNPRESSLYNGQLAAARAQLGEDDFAAARNESRAMTLEQAVRYALGDVQEA
jgi:tetratricopeptide (TPR) repeat protein